LRRQTPRCHAPRSRESRSAEGSVCSEKSSALGCDISDISAQSIVPTALSARLRSSITSAPGPLSSAAAIWAETWSAAPAARDREYVHSARSRPAPNGQAVRRSSARKSPSRPPPLRSCAAVHGPSRPTGLRARMCAPARAAGPRNDRCRGGTGRRTALLQRAAAKRGVQPRWRRWGGAGCRSWYRQIGCSAPARQFTPGQRQSLHVSGDMKN
jgi:hypothetical protein